MTPSPIDLSAIYETAVDELIAREDEQQQAHQRHLADLEGRSATTATAAFAEIGIDVVDRSAWRLISEHPWPTVVADVTGLPVAGRPSMLHYEARAATQGGRRLSIAVEVSDELVVGPPIEELVDLPHACLAVHDLATRIEQGAEIPTPVEPEPEPDGIYEIVARAFEELSRIYSTAFDAVRSETGDHR